MNDEINNFNLRVYGLLVKDDCVLVSHETFQKKNLLKFPGGGLEYGEGIREALIREWNEEMGATIQIEKLFYLTDYFIQSAFCKNDQIVSFYYLVNLLDEKITDENNEHSIDWISLDKKIPISRTANRNSPFPRIRKYLNYCRPVTSNTR